MNTTSKAKHSRFPVFTEITMIFLSFIVLAPIIYMLISSFKSKAEINRPLSLPSSLNYDNFVQAIKTGNFFTLLLNSIAVCFTVIVLTVILGSLAAYPLSRRNEKVFKFLYLYFLSGLMIPFMAGIVPLFKLMSSIGLVNNILSLVFINFAMCVPMSILIFTGFIRTVPRQLEESALVDGAGITRTFFTIIFPLLKPATVSVIIINILPIWNDFMTPLLFISSNSKRTLPLGMFNFISQFVVDMGPIFAFSLLVSIFPVALFLSLQKYFYKGIISGAVKG